MKTYNEDPNNTDAIKFAGIEYLGEVQGKCWEEKGEEKDRFGIPKGRYHKFGGQGRAVILIYPK